METVGRRPVFCLIVLGDARGHETGKQGNRPANPGQEKLPILRPMGPGRIDNEVCDVTAGCHLNRHLRHRQAAFTRTVSPPTSTREERAVPRPSTHPSDPPQPRQRHHQQRRLASARTHLDEGGGMTITA